MRDSVLMIWLLVSAVWDLFLFAGSSYLVFWRGRSGWLILLAWFLGINGTLYAALRKRYFLTGDDCNPWKTH